MSNRCPTRGEISLFFYHPSGRITHCHPEQRPQAEVEGSHPDKDHPSWDFSSAVTFKKYQNLSKSLVCFSKWLSASYCSSSSVLFLRSNMPGI